MNSSGSPVNIFLVICVCISAVLYGVFTTLHNQASRVADDDDGRLLLLHMGSEESIGSVDHELVEVRLERNQRSLRLLYDAMPRNRHGRLDHPTAAYALHRFFVHRHGWFLKGLHSTKSTLISSSSTSLRLLEQHVPNHILGSFVDRTNNLGLDLNDLALVASIIEQLVQREAEKRLRLSYSAHKVTQQDILSKQEALRVLDIYMSIYILGYGHGNLSTMTPEIAQALEEQILELFPLWPQTQLFAENVFERCTPRRDYLYFSEVESIFADITDRYSDYQDIECREMKDWLAAVEDKRIDGAGRVRLADFYNLALNEGRWQFSEKRSYLRQLGALDESDPADPRVIIPNYVNSPSNCVASSTYYSVCCLDECEGILGKLEQGLFSQKASAATIAIIVQTIPSTTVPSNRTLPRWLLRRLEQISDHHGGYIPIHGRLFAQWLHYAYPRECHFPHVAGTIDRKRPEDLGTQNVTTEASKEDMERYIATDNMRNTTADDQRQDESPMWTMTEELITPQVLGTYVWRDLVAWFHCRKFALAIAGLSVSVAIHRALAPPLSLTSGNGGAVVKHFV